LHRITQDRTGLITQDYTGSWRITQSHRITQDQSQNHTESHRITQDQYQEELVPILLPWSSCGCV